MKQTFIIDGYLPSLNDYIKAERATRYAAATMKQTWQNYIIGYVRKAHLEAMKSPVTMKYTHYVKNRRRDKDNIASIVHKFTQDALVTLGILSNDTYDDIENFSDEWHIDKNNPRIVVEIEEVNG